MRIIYVAINELLGLCLSQYLSFVNLFLFIGSIVRKEVKGLLMSRYVNKLYPHIRSTDIWMENCSSSMLKTEIKDLYAT